MGGLGIKAEKQRAGDVVGVGHARSVNGRATAANAEHGKNPAGAVRTG
jgi:hypothetical protein